MQGQSDLKLPEDSPPVLAGYPTREVQLTFGDRRVRLLTVRRLEDYVNTEALLRDADMPEPPYWAHVWVGSRSLARLMATEIECAGRRVIEIGCGLGLAGIVAALRGATVTLFDHSWDGASFAAANAALNGCRVQVMQTDVRAPALRGQFDYCLAADVTYDPLLQLAVADFLATHLAADGRAWCAESVRTLDHGFRRACERHGLRVTEHEAREVEEGRDVRVRITAVAGS